MLKRFSLVLVVATAAASITVPAQAADPGLTVLNFLKLGAGSRAAAMAGAYTAVADDATATYWNPAALLNVERNSVMGSHMVWIQGLRQEFVGFGMRRGKHAVGVSFLGLFSDDLDGRTDTGEKAGSFSYGDASFSGSYAYQVSQSIGLGVTARYVRESLGSVPIGVDGSSKTDFTLDGFAFDLGGTWKTPMKGLSAAAAVRNMGAAMSYDFDAAGQFDLPTTVQGGFAYRHKDANNGGLLVAADVSSARGDEVSFRIGAEYAFRGQFLIDAGYKTGFENQNVSFGLGYTNKVIVHYAFVPVYDDLGNSHQISLGYAW